MPTYTFKCKKCEKVLDIFAPIAKRDSVRVRCDQCSKRMVRHIAAPAVKVFKPYTHHNLDIKPVHITSERQEHEEHEKRGLTFTKKIYEHEDRRKRPSAYA